MPITVAGTQITFNDSTVQTTAYTGAPTTAQVLSATAGASFGAVGTYVSGAMYSTSSSITAGTNYAAGSSNGQILSCIEASATDPRTTNNLSGTWKNMGATYSPGGSCGIYLVSLFLRVA